MDGRLKGAILFQREQVARTLSRLEAIDGKRMRPASVSEDLRLLLARKSLNKQLWAAEDRLTELLLQEQEASK